VSAVLAVLPPVAAAVLLAFIVVMRFRGVRRARRDAIAARHPSRRRVPRRAVPGLDPDGEPLTEAELREYTGIMFRSADQPGRPAP
jgi:hypothetical protein